MRYTFGNTNRVKKLAKKLVECSAVQNSAALEGVAHCCGYRNFHELDMSTKNFNSEEKESEFSVEVRVAFLEAICKKIDVNAGDALDAVECSRFFGTAKLRMLDLLKVRVELFRRIEKYGQTTKQKGTVVNVKNLPSGEKFGILRKVDRGVTLITNSEGSSGCATFEFSTPKTQLPFFIPSRLYLPYGWWIEKDKSEVWFSRDYFPMWRFRENCSPERLHPSTKIVFNSQKFYWGRHTPWLGGSLYEELVEMIDEAGIRSLPRSVEILKILLENDSIARFSDAVPKYYDHAN